MKRELLFKIETVSFNFHTCIGQKFAFNGDRLSVFFDYVADIMKSSFRRQKNAENGKHTNNK